jgi:hypothetical protein
MDTTPGTTPGATLDTTLAADLEAICEIIDRLELHRRCLDEALAEVYTELVGMLGCYLLADGAGLTAGVAPPPGQAPRPVMTS